MAFIHGRGFKMQQFIGILGLISIIGICWALSENRRRIAWRTVMFGVGLQFLFAFLLLGIPVLGLQSPAYALFEAANNAIVAVVGYSDQGAAFLFGDLGSTDKYGFIFAFRVLPTILFFSALMGVLYHLGIMQRVVYGIAMVMHRTLKVSGAEALAAAAEIFLGQTESPLMIRPYMDKLTRSELLALMTGGMATVAGAVLAAYVGILSPLIPNIAGHLLAASIMAAPAALILSKLLVPETEIPETMGRVELHTEKTAVNVIDAAAHGASEGTKLALNVGGMLIAFVSLVALVNGLFTWLGSLAGIEQWLGHPLTLEWLLGWIFAPLAWVIGIPAHEALTVGQLLGKKLVLNEFVAYLDLAKMGDQLSDRSRVIISYALCGFANFSSIAIQLGGTGSLVPERRPDIARFGLKALLGGTLATCMTAAIVGLLI
jgi:CNT family concentrative nucleoside transporter